MDGEHPGVEVGTKLGGEWCGVALQSYWSTRRVWSIAEKGCEVYSLTRRGRKAGGCWPYGHRGQ